MILTGKEIKKCVIDGSITIDPFNSSFINPNSYNYRIGKFYKCLPGDEMYEMNEEGLLLIPGKLYLFSTIETIGSDKYVISLIGRSSVGRLGIFVQCHSDMSNLGSSHKWTLEISCIHQVKIYPDMKIGQVSFWVPKGPIDSLYTEKYNNYNLPHESILK